MKWDDYLKVLRPYYTWPGTAANAPPQQSLSTPPLNDALFRAIWNMSQANAVSDTDFWNNILGLQRPVTPPDPKQYRTEYLKALLSVALPSLAGFLLAPKGYKGTVASQTAQQLSQTAVPVALSGYLQQQAAAQQAAEWNEFLRKKGAELYIKELAEKYAVDPLEETFLRYKMLKDIERGEKQLALQAEKNALLAKAQKQQADLARQRLGLERAKLSAQQRQQSRKDEWTDILNMNKLISTYSSALRALQSNPSPANVSWATQMLINNYDPSIFANSDQAAQFYLAQMRAMGGENSPQYRQFLIDHIQQLINQQTARMRELGILPQEQQPASQFNFPAPQRPMTVSQALAALLYGVQPQNYQTNIPPQQNQSEDLTDEIIRNGLPDWLLE